MRHFIDSVLCNYKREVENLKKESVPNQIIYVAEFKDSYADKRILLFP